MLKRLSSREINVVRLMALGLKIGQVAKVLGIDNKTISTYVNRISKKTMTQGQNHHRIVLTVLTFWSFDYTKPIDCLPKYRKLITALQLCSNNEDSLEFRQSIIKEIINLKE